jgi:5-formyltetrahydrofolate cyclo-ligase
MSGKRVFREAVLADRAAMPVHDRAADDATLIDAVVHLARGLMRVAAHVPMPGEPGGPGLVSALAAAVPEVLLPVLRPDRDLDWARYSGELAPGQVRARLHEPVGPCLGVDAITTAELILVPALGVDRTGVRLGRGGGSYDRALARVRADLEIVALLYDDEVVPALPREPHDHLVTAALTPAGLIRLRPRPGSPSWTTTS